ncbi:MAG: cupin domain-containing protein [Halobacteriales archaeon]|nr:cupin domain-containing protein [Halobacteriales archaeon]
MEKASVDSLENHSRSSDVRKFMTDALNLEDLSMNYFELEPGESFSGGMHTHINPEETFFVVEGTATFQTRDGEVEVGENEAVRFAPGEYQEGRNEDDERIRALALGTPQEQGETRTLFPCGDCGAEYHEVEITESGIVLTCPDCGNEMEM